MNEHWKKYFLSNIDFIYVSDKGRIATYNNKSGRLPLIEIQGEKAYLFTPSKNSRGYLGLGIYVEGKQKRFTAHRLVALAWIHNPKPQLYNMINHKNMNKTDNKAENLEWCTNSQNIRHSFENKIRNVACEDRHGRSKLKREDVKHLLLDYFSEKNTKDFKIISEKYHITKQQVKHIVRGLHWKSVFLEVSQTDSISKIKVRDVQNEY